MSSSPTDILGKVSPGHPIALASFFFFSLFITAQAFAASDGHYTEQQAQAGHQVYAGRCSACHGAHLQGDAGPALKGRKFESSLEFGHMSAKQLYDLISKHMPKNDPGSLSQHQYLAVLAYLLKQNGFATGGSALDKKALDQITLLPLPDSSGAGSAGN